MDIKILIEQMIQLFLIIFLGYYIAKAKMIDDNFTHKFTKIILDVTMPAMILSSVLKSQERLPLLNILLISILAIVLYLIVIPLFAFFYVKVTKTPKNQQGIYIFMSIFSNIGFMGFPVMSALYGDTAVFYTAIFNLVFNIAVFTVGVPIMNYGSKHNVRFSLNSLKTPGVILSIAAILIYIINLPLPSVICTSIDTVGKITTPGAMILIGVALSKIDIKSIFTDKRLYIYSLIKQIVVPIILWCILRFIITDKFILGVVLVLLSMPVANVAVLLATEYENDEILAAKAVFVTTLMSIVTTPLVIYLCLNLWG